MSGKYLISPSSEIKTIQNVCIFSPNQHLAYDKQNIEIDSFLSKHALSPQCIQDLLCTPFSNAHNILKSTRAASQCSPFTVIQRNRCEHTLYLHSFCRVVLPFLIHWRQNLEYPYWNEPQNCHAHSQDYQKNNHLLQDVLLFCLFYFYKCFRIMTKYAPSPFPNSALC